MLIQRRYSWRGYKDQGADPVGSAANHVTSQAVHEDAVFGTVSLGFDSPAALAADELYKEEIDRFCDTGAKVCELTRLAIGAEHGSKEVLGALFHLAYIFGGLFGPVTVFSSR
jgi:hypothetical protein